MITTCFDHIYLSAPSSREDTIIQAVFKKELHPFIGGVSDTLNDNKMNQHTRHTTHDTLTHQDVLLEVPLNKNSSSSSMFVTLSSLYVQEDASSTSQLVLLYPVSTPQLPSISHRIILSLDSKHNDSIVVVVVVVVVATSTRKLVLQSQEQQKMARLLSFAVPQSRFSHGSLVESVRPPILSPIQGTILSLEG